MPRTAHEAAALMNRSVRDTEILMILYVDVARAKTEQLQQLKARHSQLMQDRALAEERLLQLIPPQQQAEFKVASDRVRQAEAGLQRCLQAVVAANGVHSHAVGRTAAAHAAAACMAAEAAVLPATMAVADEKLAKARKLLGTVQAAAAAAGAAAGEELMQAQQQAQALCQVAEGEHELAAAGVAYKAVKKSVLSVLSLLELSRESAAYVLHYALQAAHGAQNWLPADGPQRGAADAALLLHLRCCKEGVCELLVVAGSLRAAAAQHAAALEKFPRAGVPVPSSAQLLPSSAQVDEFVAAALDVQQAMDPAAVAALGGDQLHVRLLQEVDALVL